MDIISLVFVTQKFRDFPLFHVSLSVREKEAVWASDTMWTIRETEKSLALTGIGIPTRSTRSLKFTLPTQKRFLPKLVENK